MIMIACVCSQYLRTPTTTSSAPPLKLWHLCLAARSHSTQTLSTRLLVWLQLWWRGLFMLVLFNQYHNIGMIFALACDAVESYLHKFTPHHRSADRDICPCGSQHADHHPRGDWHHQGMQTAVYSVVIVSQKSATFRIRSPQGISLPNFLLLGITNVAKSACLNVIHVT